MMRCIYGIVHPDDHNELKSILEGRTFISQMGYQCGQDNQVNILFFINEINWDVKYIDNQ